MTDRKLEHNKEIFMWDCENTKEKILRVSMITRKRKRKKMWMHVTVILVFMNVARTSAN